MKSEEFATAVGVVLRTRMRNVMRMLLCAAFFTLHSSLFTSCSEADDTVEEFADWQAKNEAYFEQQYQAHAAQTATSFVLPNWSQASSKQLSEIAHTDCILVDVLESGDGGDSPLYTDKAEVHYTGKLIPSTSYSAGYSFDSSYTGAFDPEVSIPATFSVSAVVDGFSTALQHMHRGDHWRITIPYQLGYGTAANSNIPGYSTLIFDVRLADFYTE